MWRWLVLAALTLGVARAGAGEPLRLLDDQASIDLWPAATLLSDPEHRLDERSVLTRLAEFQRPDTSHANLGPRRDTVWLRVPLQVPATERGRWVLEIDYASLDQVDVFVVSDGVATQHHRLGDELPFAERPLPAASHAVVLALERGVEQELLLRVRTTSSMIVPLRLVGEAPFQARQAKVQMAQGCSPASGCAWWSMRWCMRCCCAAPCSSSTPSPWRRRPCLPRLLRTGAAAPVAGQRLAVDERGAAAGAAGGVRRRAFRRRGAAGARAAARAACCADVSVGGRAGLCARLRPARSTTG